MGETRESKKEEILKYFGRGENTIGSWSSGERARTKKTKEQTAARSRTCTPDIYTLISILLN